MSGETSGSSGNNKKVKNRFIRVLLISSGFFFTTLAIAGIFLPVLPTTPFLLVAAACFARSSESAYHWLIHNKWFGKYLSDYRSGKGIPVRIKAGALSFLWITIGVSVVFFVDRLFVRILLILLAGAVTFHILYIKSKKD